MDVLLAVLLVLAIFGAAAATYAVYRYGVFPMFRWFWNGEFRDVRTSVGWTYRCTQLGVIVGIPISCTAGVLLAAGLVWEAGLVFLIGVIVVVVSSILLGRMIREHRARQR